MEIWKLFWYPNWEMKQLRHRTWVAVRSTHEDSSPAFKFHFKHLWIIKKFAGIPCTSFLSTHINTSNNLALSQFQNKSVSPLDGLRDIERPSLPSFLWHCAFDLKDGTAAISWDLKSWSWTCPDLGEAWHTNHGRFRCATPLPGHNMHPLPPVHVAPAPLHLRRH